MRHDTTPPPPLFASERTPTRPAHPPEPPGSKSDAAPRLGSSGAGVNGQSTSQNPTPRSLSAPARRDGPSTSREAARRIAPVTGELCQRVLAYIRSRGTEGATDCETQAALGLLMSTTTARRNTLAKIEAVVDSGDRRLTPSKRRAIVWVTPEHAGTKSVTGTEGNTR